MPSIGSINFDLLNIVGDGVSVQGQVLEPIERGGVNGITYRQHGRRPMVAEYESQRGFTTAAAMVTAKNAYAQLRGPHTLIDDHGNSYPVVVLNVRITEERRADIVVGYSGQHIVTARWEMEMQLT